MGMVLGVASAVVCVINWVGGGAQLSELRAAAVPPMAMFAVGAGIRVIGSILVRQSPKLWVVLLGDVLAASLAVLLFCAVAALQDPSHVVVLAGVLISAVALPVAGIASLFASWVSRNPPLLVVLSVTSTLLILITIALQGSIYWPADGKLTWVQ